MDLLLDVKIEIAKLFDEVWILMVLYDNQFNFGDITDFINGDPNRTHTRWCRECQRGGM